MLGARRANGRYVAAGATTGDAVGNLYFLKGVAAGKLRMRPAGRNSVYTVTGTAAATVALPAVAADVTLVYVDDANDAQKL